MSKAKDHPFDEVVENAKRAMGKGFKTFQSFTCSGCGQRLTMDEPNKFYAEGTCDKCPAKTDIRKQGCNFAAMLIDDDLLSSILAKRKMH